jgi:hypothetical protein
MYQHFDSAEQQNIEQLTVALQPYRDLLRDTFATIERLIEHLAAPRDQTAESSKSLLVTIALLLRLSNDLRCVDLLASRGYPKQALTIVASMYENAYIIAFVGGNEDLAQQWLEYEDPVAPFRDFHTLVTEALSRPALRDVGTTATREFMRYHKLRRLGTANPLLRGEMGANETNESVSTNAPTTGTRAVNGASLAFEFAVWTTYVGMMSVVRECAAADTRSDLANVLSAMSRKLQELRQRSGS